MLGAALLLGKIRDVIPNAANILVGILTVLAGVGLITGHFVERTNDSKGKRIVRASVAILLGAVAIFAVVNFL